MTYLKKRIEAFGHAFRGWKWFLEGAHSRIHLLAAFVVIFISWLLGISKTHWAIICLCIVGVIGSEMINSAIEEICDEMHPEHSPKIGKAKDMAAGAVLVFSIGAVIVALLIFQSYVFQDSQLI